MGMKVEITNVNKEASQITYTYNGKTYSNVNVVSPAKIDWAKLGPADIGIKDNAVNFVKSIKSEQSSPTQQYKTNDQPKKESEYIAESSMEFMQNQPLEEISRKYNFLNSNFGRKCGASNLFRLDNGNYDAAFFVTTFLKKGEQKPKSVNNEMMGTGDGSI